MIEDEDVEDEDLDEGPIVGLPDETEDERRARMVWHSWGERPEGLPRGVVMALNKVGEGWRWRFTTSTGYVVVRKPVDDPATNGGLKTRPTAVPCESIALRLVGVDGRRAWAMWVRREDRDAWSFGGAAAWVPGSGRLPWRGDAKPWKDLVAVPVVAPEDVEQEVAA